MRKIRLEPVLEFGSRCDFAVIDVTDDPSSASGKKRGTITIDYSPADVRQLIAEGKDLAKALEYYNSRIYDLVRYYITSEWECVQGYDEAMSIIRSHIEKYFEG